LYNPQTYIERKVPSKNKSKTVEQGVSPIPKKLVLNITQSKFKVKTSFSNKVFDRKNSINKSW
jgi:hypothetical protein